jgi:subtilase family serine protease
MGLAMLVTVACGGSGSGGGPDGSPPDPHRDANVGPVLETSGASCNHVSPGTGSGLPDLAVELIGGSISYDSGTGDVTLVFTIANLTGANASPFTIAFYAYPDSTNLCRAYRIGDHQTTGIPHNMQLHETAIIHTSHAESHPPPGTYQIGFVADADNAVPESNETNNVRTFGSILTF